MKETINALIRHALNINDTIDGGLEKPTGWMPPNKREKIVEILEKIEEMTKFDNGPKWSR